MVIRWLKSRFDRKQTQQQEEARIRAAEAVWLHRRDKSVSLTDAAHQAGTTRSTVLRYFESSYAKDPGGRYRVSRADREPFDMRIVSEDGVVIRTVRGSDKRSLIGQHHNAMKAFLSPGGGDPALLAPFQGERVAGVTLLTDPDRIYEFWRQGQFDFLEIYSTSF
jgi:hypothetical protein